MTNQMMTGDGHSQMEPPHRGSSELHCKFPHYRPPAFHFRLITSYGHLLITSISSITMPSPSPDNAGSARNFPTDPSEFDRDPRISFSKLDNKYILETDDGQEFVYDNAIKRWVQSVCLAHHWLRAAPFLSRSASCDKGRHQGLYISSA